MILGRAVVSGLVALGCSDVGGVANVDNLAICEGGTVEQLRRADRMSDRCRAAVHDYLPSARSNALGRLVAFDGGLDADGARRFYVHGISDAGIAFAAPDLQALTATLARSEGDAITLSSEVLSIAPVSPSEELISIAFVNDYSASMRAADLEAISHIETELVSALPAAFEAEVTFFSSMAELRQPFTADSESTLAALAPDPEFQRKATALYSGMKTATDSLSTRTRPIRMVIVATDGVDNASGSDDRDAVLQAIEEQSLNVVVLASLFAEPAVLGELGGSRGFFFYEREASALEPLLAPYAASLAGLVQVVVPAEYADSVTYTFEADGESFSVTP